MIGFSIMMWFSSALLIFFSISLLKGNYSSVHGKVFETTNDKNGYAKALGKPVLLIGICVLLSGVIAVVLPKDYAISIAVAQMMSNIIKIHLFKNARIGITADTGVAFFCQREDYKFEVRYYPL